MRAALERHDALLRAAVNGHNGCVFATGGDGLAAAFARAGDAVLAAAAAQEAFRLEPWPIAAPVRVRMGIHTGEAAERDGDYFGPAVNRAARLMAAGHGGQVLVSGVTEALVRDGAPEQVELVDLGEHRLRDLARPIRVFELAQTGRAGGFPPLRTLDAFPGNLPLQVSSFIGRDRELARTVDALAEVRVVTLTGVGGVGKTRLALQAAAEVLPQFTDGAWLCELAPVRDPDAVADALAAVFDVAPRAGQSAKQALVEFLGGKQLLVVLDNCEHLLEPASALVATLERSCPRLGVLATSREGLGIDGERMLAVPSLSAPDADADLAVVAEADAVRLFVERAQAVKADFALTGDNASEVAQVCRRLDGVPLAIELAAARIPAMNPAELARRLDRRFEVLAGGRRGAVERHQTLRAAIDWSYELLSDAQRRLLGRLTVFVGGCTLEAAEAVCADDVVESAAVWDAIAGLVAQSLVVAEDHGLDTRYRLLETIRQYGEERLDEHGETAIVRSRHAHYYAGLARALYNRFPAIESLTRFAADQDNLIAAMSWAIDTVDIELAFRILCNHPPPSAQPGFSFRIASEPALAIPGAAEHPDYPLGLALAASQAAFRGDLDVAEQWCDKAIAAEGRLGTHSDGTVDRIVAGARGAIAMSVGSWREAAVCYQLAAEIARTAGGEGLYMPLM
jgi:predicted ATPase